MRLLRDLQSIRGAGHRGAVATIGGFDGIHRGHQALLQRVRERADQLGTTVMVISFEPSPREFFMGDRAPARLQRFKEKFAALEACGVDWFVCLRFDATLRDLPAQAFVTQVLQLQLGVRELVVGHDFRFGRGREGDVTRLRQWAEPLGMGVEEFAPHCMAQERVSSTLVRTALACGDLARATQLLGRPYSITGRVVHGQKLGRTLGFPTANLRLQRRVIPLQGIFAVRVTGAGLSLAPAVASLGTRPAVNGIEPLLEVHVFDFNGDLYGQSLRVDFVSRLRDERWFPDLESLVAQIRLDVAEARAVLGA